MQHLFLGTWCIPIRIGKVSNLLSAGISDFLRKEIRTLFLRFSADQDGSRGRIKDGLRRREVGSGGIPQMFRSSVRNIHHREERLFPFWRRAQTSEVNSFAVRRQLHDWLARRIEHFKRLAGIVIAVFEGAFEQFDGRCESVRRKGKKDAFAVFPAALFDQREMSVAPVDSSKAERKLCEFARRRIEWSVKQEQSIAKGSRFAGIAAVGGFDPEKASGSVAPPLVAARACCDRIANDGNVVFERLVGQLLRCPGFKIDDKHALRESFKRKQIGVGMVAFQDENKLRVGRRGGGFEDAGLAEWLGSAIEADDSNL